MKRKMALILAAVLAVSAVFTSYAMNAGWGKQDTVSGRPIHSVPCEAHMELRGAAQDKT